jgi:hypothetical protein
VSTSKRPAAWAALASHAQSISKVHLRQLFADDPKRGQRMALEAVGLYLDYSKNRVTDETLRLLPLPRPPRIAAGLTPPEDENGQAESQTWRPDR